MERENISSIHDVNNIGCQIEMCALQELGKGGIGTSEEYNFFLFVPTSID